MQERAIGILKADGLWANLLSVLNGDINEQDEQLAQTGAPHLPQSTSLV